MSSNSKRVGNKNEHQTSIDMDSLIHAEFSKIETNYSISSPPPTTNRNSKDLSRPSQGSDRGIRKERPDEVCFLKLRQTKEGREAGLHPSLEMICLSKKNANNSEREYLHTKDFDAAVDHIKGMSDRHHKSDPSLRVSLFSKVLKESDATQSDKTVAVYILQHMMKPFVHSSDFTRKYIQNWNTGKPGQTFDTFYTGIRKGMMGQYAKKVWGTWKGWFSSR